MIKVNIVTVNYNNLSGIDKTIDNVKKLKLKYDVNYIIIDGASTDGSVGVINDNLEVVDFKLSEPDSGIYNAMNKAIGVIDSGYIIFLNSGDILDLDNFEEFYRVMSCGKYDFIYGDYSIDRGSRIDVKRNKQQSSLWKGYFCHQSMAVKLDVFQNNKFDESLKICADTKFVIRAINSGVSIKKIDLSLAIIEPGGLSDLCRITSISEQWKLTKKYSNISHIRINLFFAGLYFRNLVLIFLRGFGYK
ncbi:glycosyltransferase [Vibrio alfacsensis]|uniref:glycosyltransferase n=1 Tax=Vibrio alfacsensis TaxID=1074311 RepID=UPI00406880F1